MDIVTTLRTAAAAAVLRDFHIHDTVAETVEFLARQGNLDRVCDDLVPCAHCGRWVAYCEGCWYYHVDEPDHECFMVPSLDPGCDRSHRKGG